MTNERGPGIFDVNRKGRGRPRFWNCDVRRYEIVVIWRQKSIEEKRVLRVFMIKYKDYIPWVNYGVATGDGQILAQNDFFNWEKTVEEIGDMRLSI